MVPPEDRPEAGLERALGHERVANEVKHWVRLTAACNSRCRFCLDAEAQDGRILAFDDVAAEIRRGREDKGATRIVLSGGEGSLHPRFHDAVRYAKEIGYRWVQTVTNGQRFANRTFFLDAMDAGLDEITFSLHGHTAALHDDLTQTKNGFENLLRAMLRAVRDGRPVVNVDVCINRRNVEHLEEIVALCARLGVKEFDLLHIIPQGVAFEHREELFYDVDAHAEALRKVFRLARQPGFHVWTNRFPLSHLEDMEELIQDPHKMLDEVGGRRVQFRRYLDQGQPIDCRDARRCPHCFIEPFCSALDGHLRDVEAGRYDVWWVGDRPAAAGAAPPGVRWTGTSVPLDPWPGPVWFRGDPTVPLPPGSRRVIDTVAGWASLAGAPDEAEVEIHLDRALCEAILAAPERLTDRMVLHAPTRPTMEASARLDPDWRAFFAALPPGRRASNLPPCLAPGAALEEPARVLAAALFHHDGSPAIDPFVEDYIAHRYRAKSLRCRGCRHDAVCPGAHVQYLRAHGFRQLQPVAGEPAPASATPRLRDGSPPVPPIRRVPVAGNDPVPWIDTAPGRRS